MLDRAWSGYTPVQQTTKSTRDQRGGEVGREAESKDADASASQSTEKNRFAPKSVTQSTPDYAGRELGKGKDRSDHSRIERYPFLIIGDVKGSYHVIDVGKDGHERHGLA